MKCLISLASAILIAAQFTAFAAACSEEDAVQKIKKLPEVVALPKGHEYTFDDNELIKDARRLPSTIALPAWRIDVRTIVHDPETDHLSLCYRFIVASSGQIYVWERVSDRYLSIDEWRRLKGGT
jgi:hypothetical protein